MQESNRRIESHHFQSRPDIMYQMGVDERQQGIDIIQRRPPVSFLKNEIIFLCYNEMIENAEIEMRGISFKTPHGIQRVVVFFKRSRMPGQALYGKRYFTGVILSLWSRSTRCRTVRLLAILPVKRHRVTGRRPSLDRLPAVLFSSKQDISRHRPLDPGEENGRIRIKNLSRHHFPRKNP